LTDCVEGSYGTIFVRRHSKRRFGAPTTLDFDGRIQSERFAPIQERVASFRANAAPARALEEDHVDVRSARRTHRAERLLTKSARTV
jgi:hypothetical protein